jgi:hypothetical protein
VFGGIIGGIVAVGVVIGAVLIAGFGGIVLTGAPGPDPGAEGIVLDIIGGAPTAVIGGGEFASKFSTATLPDIEELGLHSLLIESYA